MRYLRSIWVVAFLLFIILMPNGHAGDKPIQKGEPFPNIRLPIPKEPTYLKYLGLSGEGDFGIQDIKAEVVVIQIFNSG